LFFFFFIPTMDWEIGKTMWVTFSNTYLFEGVVGGQFGAGFDFVEARGHVCGRADFRRIFELILRSV
jgi:hypothetical protein